MKINSVIVQDLFKFSVNSLVSIWCSVLLSNTLQSEKGRYHVTKPSLLMRSSYPPISERKMGDFLELLRHLYAARLIYVTSCLQLFNPISFWDSLRLCLRPDRKEYYKFNHKGIRKSFS